MFGKCVTSLLSVLLIAIVGGGAQARDYFAFDPPSHPEPRTQIAVGLGMRLDSRQQLSPQADLTVQLIRFVHKDLAVKAEGHFNNRISFGRNAQATSYLVGTGLRLQAEPRLFTPFAETDVSIQWIRGESNGYEVRSAAFGLGVGVGLSIRADKRNRFDVGIHQVLNRFGMNDYVITGPPLPDDDFPDYWRGFGGPDVDDLFNPAQFYFRYRLAL
ncbi:MAG: hypothetical protein KKA42_13945 [candidate division Zixibacteria bacterium]|nr:hypothetical protein [candidate division Zixibacteria bacterium]